VVLAVLHYSALLGVPLGSTVAWALPATYAAAAGIGLTWGLMLRARHRQLYASVGLGVHAVTGQTEPASRILP
jgi:hypothetical protein